MTSEGTARTTGRGRPNHPCRVEAPPAAARVLACGVGGELDLHRELNAKRFVTLATPVSRRGFRTVDAVPAAGGKLLQVIQAKRTAAAMLMQPSGPALDRGGRRLDAARWTPCPAIARTRKANLQFRGVSTASNRDRLPILRNPPGPVVLASASCPPPRVNWIHTLFPARNSSKVGFPMPACSAIRYPGRSILPGKTK